MLKDDRLPEIIAEAIAGARREARASGNSAVAPGLLATTETKPVTMSITNQTDMPCCPSTDEGKCCNVIAIALLTPLALLPAAEAPPASFSEGTLRGHITLPTHPPPI